MGTGASGKSVLTSPGSETMACVTFKNIRQTGRPCTCFHKHESMPDNLKREKGKIRYRESDNLIVPENACNAAGGKEVTYEKSAVEKHHLCPETGIRWKRNCCV